VRKLSAVAITVSALSITPVKGTRLHTVDEIELGWWGAAGDRRFYVIDDRGRMVNGKVLDGFQSVIAEYSEPRLRLSLPTGRTIEAAVGDGEHVQTTFFSVPREATLVDGGFSEVLSEHFGRPLRLVQTDSAVDRGPDGAASLISGASLARLAAEAGSDGIDARRFRMLIEVDGIDAHAEDAWVGSDVRVGEALVRFAGHVGRCLITSQDPETGRVDLPTLDLLRAYRGAVQSTEPLPFGIYGEVVEPGLVRIGDSVTVLDPKR
jgi:uncharacterized protein YcbX